MIGSFWIVPLRLRDFFGPACPRDAPALRRIPRRPRTEPLSQRRRDAFLAGEALGWHFRLTTSESTASSGRQGAPQALSEANMLLTAESAVERCSMRRAFRRDQPEL